MNGIDILINKQIDNTELISALSKLLTIPPTEILIVYDIAELEKQNSPYQLVCQKVEIQGDFSLLLSLYPQNEATNELTKQFQNYAFTGKLGEILGCACLISDDTIDPYQWILIQNNKNWQTVELDPDKLDDHESYVISKSLVTS
jgi:hypothetical protein